MKYICKLCGEEFDLNDCDISNINGEIIISCPNECSLITLYIPDFTDDIVEVK